MLVNAIGYLAEAAYHHPDLTVTWGRVTVKLQNHAAGGITDKDFELARKIEEIGALASRRAARSRARRTSGCGRGIHGSAARQSPVRHRAARGAGAPARPRASCGRRSRHEVAVLKITVAALMTTPWIARFLEVPPGTDLVLIPGLCEGDTEPSCASASACASRRARRISARSPATSVRRRRPSTTAPTTSRSSPRSTTPPSSRPPSDPRRRRLLPRERRRHHRHRLYAGPRLSRPRRRRPRAARRRHAGEHRQLRARRDPDRGRGRRRAGAQRQRLQSRGRRASSRAAARASS